MEYRAVLLASTVWATAALLAWSSGCAAPDPGSITFGERGGATGEPQGSSNGGGTSGTSGTSGGTSSGTSGTPAEDTIFGATAFMHVAPTIVANTANVAHSGTVEGKDCIQMGCHLGGNRPWLFAGTVYSAATGGVTVPKAEIRVVGPDGAEVGHTYTDANGNFWLDQGGKTIPAGSFVGVRKEGGATMKMATALSSTDAGCTANRANCHGASQGKVYAQ